MPLIPHVALLTPSPVPYGAPVCPHRDTVKRIPPHIAPFATPRPPPPNAPMGRPQSKMVMPPNSSEPRVLTSTPLPLHARNTRSLASISSPPSTVNPVIIVDAL